MVWSYVQAINVEHIEISPDVRAGKPRIVDTRIAVEDVAIMHLKLGQSLIEIAGIYNLALASVYAAMFYYFDHRDEIDQRIVEESALLTEMERVQVCPLQAKLERLKGA